MKEKDEAEQEEQAVTVVDADVVGVHGRDSR